MTHLTYSKKDAIRIVTMAAKDYGNIRKLSPESHQILAILSKPASGKTPCYQNIRYLAKGVRLEKLLLPPELYSILDLSLKLTSQTGSPPGTQPLTPPRPEQSETPSFSP